VVDECRREKLLEKIRNSPGKIRFDAVDALLRYEGFVLFNQRGSHHDDRRWWPLIATMFGLSLLGQARSGDPIRQGADEGRA
jgi:hypothetical protein